MHLPTAPQGGRAKAHKHAPPETAIHVVSGHSRTCWGARLENVMETGPGGMFQTLSHMPHLPFTPGAEEAMALIARADPRARESVVLLPEPEALVPGQAHQMPDGMFRGSRWICFGAVSSFHFESALCAEGKAGRGTKRPRPGWGCEFCPQAQITSPRLIV